MELWVRSQDKEDLVKVSGMRINYLRENELIGYVDYDESITLGEYATKERALEVLDEIQKMLDGRWIKEKIPSASMQNIFPIMLYEMPKE